MAKTKVVMYSALESTAAAEALARTIDWEHRSWFSLSGYEGNRPMIGVLSDGTFRVYKRRYWRNDFAPQFYGSMHAEPRGGTRVEGFFDLSPWVRVFMRWWLGGVVLIGGTLFILSGLDVFAGGRFVNGDPWVGIIVPPAMIVFGLLLPRFGRLLSQGDERSILQHLETVFAARVEHPETPR